MPKKKVLMAVLALIFAVMQILPAFANELEDKQAEYDDVQQKMQQMEIAKNVLVVKQKLPVTEWKRLLLN